MNSKTVLSSLVLLAGLALGMVAPDSARAETWFNCDPETVFDMVDQPAVPNQIQVACKNVIKGMAEPWHYVGVQTGGAVAAGAPRLVTAAEAQRFLSTAMAAILSGKTLRVYVTDANCPTQNAATVNCKLVTSWSLMTP